MKRCGSANITHRGTCQRPSENNKQESLCQCQDEQNIRPLQVDLIDAKVHGETAVNCYTNHIHEEPHPKI